MIYKTRRQALDALHSQPFTLACRARHIVVACFDRDLLGEKVSDRPVGYCYRLRGAGEQQ